MFLVINRDEKAAALPGYLISHKNRKYCVLFAHTFQSTNYNKPLL